MNSKQFLYIVIATFITVMAWVILDILHTRSQVQIPSEVQQLITPISPNFDIEVMNEL